VVCVDYMNKWVEAIATRTNESRVVLRLLRENIFARYRMPRAITSGQGTHFDNQSFDAQLSIIDRLAAPYYPQTNYQVEMSNGLIK